MTGIAYLGGGGTGEDEALLWDEMLEGCRRLLYWPFALKGAMEQVLDDKSSGYANTIKKLRAKYDFDELKDDDVAKFYIGYISDGWVVDGRDKLLKVDPAQWQKTYDAAVKVKAAKPNIDITKNVVPGIA